MQQTPRACPNVPPVHIVNPHSYPIAYSVHAFTVNVHCASAGALYGATFMQLDPLPPVVNPIKIGDANATGLKLTFTPAPKTLTLAPHTKYGIVVLPETSTSSVAFPAAPGSITNLTANNPAITSGTTFDGLTFTYSSSSGASFYSAACFPAFSNGQLAQLLQRTALVGKPAFYCELSTPDNAPITFGQTVKFNILSPPPDRALFEPDGVPQGFACSEPTDNASSCNVPQFSIPTTYQNFIVGNVQDLRLCVPAQANTDCNNVGSNPQGRARTTVPCCKEFQLLVADDPTYAPPSSSVQPWDGVFRMTYSGACAASPDTDTDHDAPPGYSDNPQKAIGPAAELDVQVLKAGTCTITVTEDARYILDDSNPSAPKPRSTTINLTVTS